jgi:hypothetical protein
MASCIDPSSPAPSDYSGLERQKIYLSQQQKQHLNQSACNDNFSPFSAFKPIDEESSIVCGQVYNPIKSLVNGWTDFSIANLTTVVSGDSDVVRGMNTKQIMENIKKRKGEENTSLKVTLLIQRTVDQINVKVKILRYLSR